MTHAEFLLRPGVTAGIAACLLALVAASGLDVGRDFQIHSAARHSQSQKQHLALLGQLELGYAVQDFKDCLLRGESIYCEEFQGHIQALDRNLTLYSAQRLEHPAERKALDALRHSLPAYELALDEVRDMQSRHATVQEIDSVVRGADRPVADELSALATLSSRTDPQWPVPLGPMLFLMTCAALAGYFLFLTFGSSQPWRRRLNPGAQPIQLLLNRVIQWEEDAKTRAFARLHEEVCQSLTAVMYFLESLQPTAAGDGHSLPEHLPASVIPTLRTAIQNTRSVALQLRPVRVQEAGVLATLQSLWIDTRVLNPRLRIEPHARLNESDIPENLKPIILRVARMIADWAAEGLAAAKVVWILERNARALQLSVELAEHTESADTSVPSSIANSVPELLNAIQARVVLSGGSSELIHTGARSGTIVSTWICDTLEH